jgi:hypothetical protein
MDDRPLAPLLTEVGMHLLTRLLVPLRRVVLGEDGWSDFLEFGHDGHPWWHFREDEAGHLVLIRPGVPEPMRAAVVTPASASRARTAAAPSRVSRAAGVSIVLPSGRSTTPIPDYSPAVHGPLVAALDLLLYLIDRYELRTVPRRTPGLRILRATRAMSLLARDWGHTSGQGERRADRTIALLGERGVLGRTIVGARVEYHLPANALERFERTFGFTVR